MQVKTASGLLAWLMRRAGFKGWTSFWQVVYVLPGHESNERLLRHEAEHLRQIEPDGRLVFAVRYLWKRATLLEQPLKSKARAAEAEKGPYERDIPNRRRSPGCCWR
jgi:hypothetical protein